MQVSEIKNEGLELHYKIVVPESEIAVKLNEKLQYFA
jgi:FKBP-type peptidyl-prolyl cis-trans isomerase (trigger factor)